MKRHSSLATLSKTRKPYLQKASMDSHVLVQLSGEMDATFDFPPLQSQRQQLTKQDQNDPPLMITFDNPQEAFNYDPSQTTPKFEENKNPQNCGNPMILAISQEKLQQRPSHQTSPEKQSIKLPIMKLLPLKGLTKATPSLSSQKRLPPALQSQRGVILSETPRVVPASKILRREQNIDIKKGNIIMVKRITDIMTGSISGISQQPSQYQAQLEQRKGQERKAQLSKIMVENFRMLDRIKNSRSHYILQGPSTHAKKSLMAEKLADGLIKVPILFKHREERDHKSRAEINQSNLNLLNSSLTERQHSNQRSIITTSLIEHPKHLLKPLPISTLSMHSDKTPSSRSHYQPPPHHNPSLSHRTQSRSGCGIGSLQRVLLDIEEHRVLKNISKPYEKARAKELFERLAQIKELPEKRRVMLYKKKVAISGREDTLFIVEVARTKHKAYLTAVSMKDPHDHSVIESFRKVFEKRIASMQDCEGRQEKLEKIISQLEFVNIGTDRLKLILRDEITPVLQRKATNLGLIISRDKSTKSQDRTNSQQFTLPQVIPGLSRQQSSHYFNLQQQAI
ncbi:hypothetical protein FGO68_gene11900 [Halteria grandinella]|uniref:Uncharacterized protein n=1 Tax=Halteria grandinella TaxID=5974 RepID=A0A8J8T2X7_HALGN|nr:hypothetical protein FGO68_gene11900 [Halteria grandinella]